MKEETGFDITPYLHEHEYVERTIKGQRIRLYILTGVPEDTKFVPQTRKEIGVWPADESAIWLLTDDT